MAFLAVFLVWLGFATVLGAFLGRVIRVMGE